MKLLITQFSQASYHFILLGSNYSPQDSFLKYPVYVFPVMSEAKLHTHLKYRQNYSFVYFKFYDLISRVVLKGATSCRVCELLVSSTSNI
jgi:hypothetical protein